MKYKREYMIGGAKKDTSVDDYISAYIAENGKRIEVKHGFSNWSNKWYEVSGFYFESLKDAKEYCEKNFETVIVWNDGAREAFRYANKEEAENALHKFLKAYPSKVVGYVRQV